MKEVVLLDKNGVNIEDAVIGRNPYYEGSSTTGYIFLFYEKICLS